MSPFEQRYKFIEVMITWQGRVNASHLIKHFAISRKQASATFTKYISRYPNSIIYREEVKGFVALTDFKRHYCSNEFSEYQGFVNYSQQPIFATIEQVVTPTRNPNPRLAKPILRAIDNKLAIDIGYTSLSSPDYEDRIIEPHSLIFDGLRWHVRAYCQKNQAFRDFVLSRFNGEVIDEGKAKRNASEDDLWHEFIDIEIEPDPRLNTRQRQVIADDYQMVNGKLTINTRKALITYLIKNMRLDTEKDDPTAQQITLTPASKARISQYRYDL